MSEKKEDVEFRELKELLLKFEKNAPNMSSDFDLSGYDDLIESSNLIQAITFRFYSLNYYRPF
jgi:hypothetical protein